MSRFVAWDSIGRLLLLDPIATLLSISLSLLSYFPMLSPPTFIIFHVSSLFRAISHQSQLPRALYLGPRG